MSTDRKLSYDQEELLAGWIVSRDFNRNSTTTDDVMRAIASFFNVSVSKSWVSRFRQRWGFSYRKPSQQQPHERDPQSRLEAIRFLEEIRRRKLDPSQIVCLDKTTFYDHNSKSPVRQLAPIGRSFLPFFGFCLRTVLSDNVADVLGVRPHLCEDIRRLFTLLSLVTVIRHPFMWRPLVLMSNHGHVLLSPFRRLSFSPFSYSSNCSYRLVDNLLIRPLEPYPKGRRLDEHGVGRGEKGVRQWWRTMFETEFFSRGDIGRLRRYFIH